MRWLLVAVIAMGFSSDLRGSFLWSQTEVALTKILQIIGVVEYADLIINWYLLERCAELLCADLCSKEDRRGESSNYRVLHESAADASVLVKEGG